VFPEPVEERDFRLPGVERVQLEGRTVSLFASRNLEAIMEHIRMLRAGNIDVLPVSLKEIFLQKVKARP
jgi:ABC-2 type transport system ATP-binding protein